MIKKYEIGEVEVVRRIDEIPAAWGKSIYGRKKLFIGLGAESKAFKFLCTMAKREKVRVA